MTVRPARPEDARAIAEVHVRTWQAAYRHALPADVLDSLSVDERQAQWRSWLEEGAKAWVALEDDGVVGLRSTGFRSPATEQAIPAAGQVAL